MDVTLRCVMIDPIFYYDKFTREMA